jgi:hypothetical protein
VALVNRTRTVVQTWRRLSTRVVLAYGCTPGRPSAAPVVMLLLLSMQVKPGGPVAVVGVYKAVAGRLAGEWRTTGSTRRYPPHQAGQGVTGEHACLPVLLSRKRFEREAGLESCALLAP